ncbi:MAG: 2-hydroxyacid dehydrogenase [Fimbriiglobus sp.]
MQLALFGAKGYDREFFAAAAPAHAIDVKYLEPRLGPDTAGLAAGFPAVCAFVNDDLSAPVVNALADGGTKLIALRCAGFNNVDLAAATARGMTVARVPAYSPHAVAEYTVALMLTLNRKTHKAYNRVREGNFAIDGLAGSDLFGKTAGVVGTGKIGAIVCRILAGFGMRVLAFDVHPNPDAVAAGAEYVPLPRLFAESDVVTLHCPLTAETRHLVGSAVLATMKPTAMLVNTGRGALIDTIAVVRALKAGELGALAVDVYEEEEGVFFEDHTAHGVQDDVLARLLTFPNVLVTGHQAFLTAEALTAIAETTLGNVARFARGEPCPNRLVG